MARMFKVNTVNSDGTEADTRIDFEVVDAQTSKPFVGDDGKPSVVITMRPVSQALYRQIQARHTNRVLNKKTRAMEEITDWESVQDDIVDYAILSWRGIIGADDQPLQCVTDAKLGLPADLKYDLMMRAMQGESVDDKAASFRPAS